MSASTAPTLFDWAKDIGVPLLTFILGFAVSRWTLTKKDRKEFEQKNFDNVANLLEQHDAAYAQYTKALAAYAQAARADINNFTDIATLGDRYFIHLNLLASAIMSDKVDGHARDYILLPKIRDVVDRTLPQHYGALKSMSDKYGFGYRGRLRRGDYGALYDVVHKYGAVP